MNASEVAEQAEEAEDAELVAWLAAELGVRLPDSIRVLTPIATGDSQLADKGAEEPLGSSGPTQPPVSEEAVRIADRVLGMDAMPRASAMTEAPETAALKRTEESKPQASGSDQGGASTGRQIRQETSASRQRVGSAPSAAASADVTRATADAVLLVAGKRVAVPPDGCIIGRDPGLARIVVHDEEVSRQHARIVVRAATMSVHDLGSTNGTVVRRGQRDCQITEAAFQLAPDDQIRTGTGVLMAEVPDTERS